MYKFIYEPDEDDYGVDGVEGITFQVNQYSDLTDMCQIFGRYLKALGYSFNGEITILEDDHMIVWKEHYEALKEKGENSDASESSKS